VTQTVVAPAPLTERPSGPYGPPGFPDTVRSEWTKMRTLRSTPITLAVTAFLVIGLSALITLAVVSNPSHSGSDARRHPLTIIQSGWGLGLLAFEVLGVLVVTNEYSSGLIAETLLATPRRIRVLLAKVVVFVVLVFCVAEVMSFVNFFVGRAVISAYPPFPNVALTDHNVLRAVIGEGIDAALVGLIGLALGAILRHTAGAITASVAVLFVLPLVLMALPTSWEQPVEKYWPTEAGSQLEQVTRQAHALTAWWGTGDLALFVLVLLVGAGYALVKRDA
jgi:ABC-2 type transport system permease protein